MLGANAVYKQSEVLRQSAAAMRQQTPEAAAQQLVQRAFWAEMSCKNIAVAALLASLLTLAIGALFVRFFSKKDPTHTISILK